MGELPDFQRQQYEFAAHIRDPARHCAPADIEDRRMAIYRDLFFNNLSQLLSSTFPVLRKLHKLGAWRAMIRDFMANYEAQTPYFLELPHEFLRYLQETRVPADGDLPFLIELAHYEWVELALSISVEQNDMSMIDPDGDLLAGAPVLSVLAWPLAYQYPVHRISTEFQPREPGEQPVFLIVYRGQDDELGFMELNAVTARLLELIRDNESGQSGRALLETLAKELGYEDSAPVIDNGARTLSRMHKLDIVLGSKNNNDQEKDQNG